MKEVNTQACERGHMFLLCSLHPGVVPRSSCGDGGMELQARMFPAAPTSPQADKQVALRGFNFLHHRAAVCLSYREPLNALGSSSNAFCGHREITESPQGTLSGRESSTSVVHPALPGVCASASHPPPHSQGAQLHSELSCGSSLMEHSGLRSKTRPKVNPSPRHKADTGRALAPAGWGSRRRLLLSAHGQKGSAELFLAPTLQNKKQLQAIVCFLSIFSPPCLFPQIYPPGAEAEGLFREEGAPLLSTGWGHSSHRPGAVPGALRDRGHGAAELSCFSFQSTAEEGGVSHSEENPPPFQLCLRGQPRVEALR